MGGEGMGVAGGAGGMGRAVWLALEFQQDHPMTKSRDLNVHCHFQSLRGIILGASICVSYAH